MTPRSVVSNSLPSAPTSPATIYSPSLTMSNSGQLSAGDYFATTRHHSSGSSTPYTLASPLQTPNEDLNESNGPGPVRRRRTSSGASFASIRPNGVPTPLMRPPPPRKRGSQQSIHGGDKKDNDSDGLLWTIDVAESATWCVTLQVTRLFVLNFHFAAGPLSVPKARPILSGSRHMSKDYHPRLLLSQHCTSTYLLASPLTLAIMWTSGILANSRL